LDESDIEGSKKFFYNSIKELLEGKVHISELVTSKTVKTEYANPNMIAHKVLADRMGERDPGNKPQSNDRIPYCYIHVSNLKCKLCAKKINAEKSKCIDCMSIFCVSHLNNHRECCIKVCRFCKVTEGLEKCSVCTGNYCSKCFIKHQTGKNKFGKEHQNKCKKPLTHKLLQGDTIEHPEFILENKWKMDYFYYLTNQIEKPVYQIFELVMSSPQNIIKDLVRDARNRINQNNTIQMWFKPVSTLPFPIEKGKFEWNAHDEEENMLDFIEIIDEEEIDVSF
jgi:hypothetical protein